VTVRPATRDDLPALLAVERECFGPAAWSEALLLQELTDIPDTRHAVVLEDDGAVIGYGVLSAVGQTADLERVAVARACRRVGAGRRILAALLAQAARRGCPRVLLEVAADNVAARALYDAAGFAVIAERRNYYGAGRHAVVMSRMRDWRQDNQC